MKYVTSKRRRAELRLFDRFFHKVYKKTKRITFGPEYNRPRKNRSRNKRKKRERRSPTANDIMQAQIDKFGKSTPDSSAESRVNVTSSDPSGEPRNSPSSPNEHTEEIFKEATIDDDIVIVSDSSSSSEEASIRTRNDKDVRRRRSKSKRRPKKLDGEPSTSGLDTRVHRPILKLNNDHNLPKPKGNRKIKNLRSTGPIPNGYTISHYAVPQSNNERKKKRLRNLKESRLSKKMQTRTGAIQFESSDEENNETFADDGIDLSENEVTFTQLAPAQSSKTDVNYEVVSEPSPSFSHTNEADAIDVRQKNQSIDFDDMKESQSVTTKDQMNLNDHVAGPEMLGNHGISANQRDEEDKSSVGDYSLISGDDLPENASNGGHQFYEVHVNPEYENVYEGNENYYYGHRGEGNYGNRHKGGGSPDYADENGEYYDSGNGHGDGGSPDYGDEDEANYYNENGYSVGGSPHYASHYNGNGHEGGENTGYANHYYNDVHEDDYTNRDEWDDYNHPRPPKIWRHGTPTSCDPSSAGVISVPDLEPITEIGQNDVVDHWIPNERARFPFSTSSKVSNSPTFNFLHRHSNTQPIRSPDAIQSSCITSANESEAVDLSLQEHRASNDSSPQSFASYPLSNSIQFFTSPICQPGKVLLLLKTKLYFHGSLNIRLLAGHASIFGYELQRNVEVTANSFPAHGVLHLCPESSRQRYVGIDKHIEELSEYLTSSDINKIETEFDSSSDAIVELETEYGNKSIAMIEKYMGEDIIANVNTLDKCSQFYQTESVLRCNFSQDTEIGLKVNPQWQKIEMSINSRLVIIGGKAVGTSTVLRYLINKNLRRFPKILLIDLDIDRPEIFVPKTISATIVTKPLLGPGFLRCWSPIKSYLFNDAIISSPTKYLQCINKLLKYCRSVEELAAMPWIIITRGYINRIDFELTTAIVRTVNPTDLVQIHGHDSFEFEIILTAITVNSYRFEFVNGEAEQQVCSYRLHEFDTVLHIDQVNLWNNSTVNLQLAICLARLSHKLPWDANLIKIKPPVCASLNSLRILVDDDDSVATYEAINGNMCYLCQSMDDHIIECYGIGFVRAVDVAANRVYLLPSIDNTELEKVNTLVVCAVAVPKFMLIDRLPRTNISVPYMYRE